MKFLIGFISFFSFFTLISQTPEELIEDILNSSNNYDQVNQLKKNLEAKNYDYSIIFNSVPDISPIRPTDIKRTSSNFGKRTDPFTHRTKFHYGIDFSCGIGTTVYATADGTVTRADFKQTGYGRSIKLKHDYGFETLFGHLSIIMVKKIGQKVKKGEIIGLVGSTGKSTGYHLHYEIIKNNKKINPSSSF